MSATPSATRQNLTADPSICLTAPGRLAMKASVLGSPCDRLTATFHGCRAAGNCGYGSARPRGRRLAQRHPLGAAADQPAPYQPERRRADDAEQRPAVGHQRNIDGILVVAGDEFLGAVERIDQEEAAS